jgi:tripartite-type tricarboxylate transporter receptor subunit TctC
LIQRLWVAVAVFAVACSAAAAQDFPTRPVTIVVPFPAGGPIDFLVRSVQQKLEADLGQAIVVESRPGATGNVGNAYVAKAAADGYTLLATATNIGVFPHIFRQLAYDPLHDIIAIGGLAETPNVCVVNSAGKFQSFPTLIAEAKANPGSIKFGSSGLGAPSHLIVELIGRINHVTFTHVPYKGAAPAINDVLGNFISFMCVGGLSGVMSLIADGKLRAVAVTSDKRSPLLPDVPTLAELGLGNINEGLSYILLAPAMTPQPVQQRLSAALAKAVAEPSVKDTFGKLGYVVITKSPAEVNASIQQQYDLWGPVVKDLNLKLD